jgi:hypothetical protein
VEAFQIVNGCQTSHVIAANSAEENQAIMIPIKIISTEDEEVMDPFSAGFCILQKFSARIGGGITCSNAARLLRIK